MKLTPEQKHETEAYLQCHSSWNGGAGLIVPPSIARTLRENGITGPYTESKPLPLHEGLRNDT